MHRTAGRVEQAYGDRVLGVPGDHGRGHPGGVQAQCDRARVDRERLAAQARYRVAARLVESGDRAAGERLDVAEEGQTAGQFRHPGVDQPCGAGPSAAARLEAAAVVVGHRQYTSRT
ncbi:hypothetical protein [Streptomyces sp. MB09-02B]|uniref:hypothetical protein n=1 Tax=Streptomyces sp. MB09-02B TaxID=3028667 RepID=UPI0029A3A8B0|nr:hypothetical protein [Streptomyces sp. MB09-02B]MDX3643470.1 hypothetical protein [Streptomyces sp. MB09-02B]